MCRGLGWISRAAFVLPAAELEWSGEAMTLTWQALAPEGPIPA